MLIRYILFIMLTSCSFIDDSHFYVDSRLQKNVNAFYHEAEIRGIQISKENLSVIIGNISDSGLTSCSKDFCTITINSSFYKNNEPDEIAMQYIIFHEFGHYIGREHNNYYSIMNPNKYAADYKQSIEKRKILIDELFK